MRSEVHCQSSRLVLKSIRALREVEEMERTLNPPPHLPEDFPPEDFPVDLTLSETLQMLVRELTHCAETLRETHELVSPQLAELERRYPIILTKSDDQRSLGRASSSYPA